MDDGSKTESYFMTFYVEHTIEQKASFSNGIIAFPKGTPTSTFVSSAQKEMQKRTGMKHTVISFQKIKA